EIDWIFLTSMAGNFEALEVIFKFAKIHNVKIAMNPGKGELRDIDKLKKLLPKITILSMNKEEMAMLYKGSDLETLVKEANKDVHYVVCTDGPNGVVAADRWHIIKAGIYEDVPVIDRSGAGDAFSSGFTAMIAANQPLEQAITFASANSTSVVGSIGAKTGILQHDALIHPMPLTVKEL
ncbi:MAG: carbohydrate kinase family protein, partial [Candidatus Saccharibacteria bacterium]